MSRIIVKKVKGITPNFDPSSGPTEVVTLGLEVDGLFVNFGTYYFGPYMKENHGIVFDKLERFIDECVRKFEKEEELSG